MTLEQHSKTLGALHLVFGGVQTLLTFVILGFMWLVLGGFGDAPHQPGGELSPAFFWGIMIFAVLLQTLFTLPSFVAGYAILKRKPWAKTAGVVASVVGAMSFPHGTALSVYSLWFLCGRYDELEQRRAGVTGGRWRGSLYAAPPPPAADWMRENRRGRQPERDYAPPPQPPDWR